MCQVISHMENICPTRIYLMACFKYSKHMQNKIRQMRLLTLGNTSYNAMVSTKNPKNIGSTQNPRALPTE